MKVSYIIRVVLLCFYGGATTASKHSSNVKLRPPVIVEDPDDVSVKKHEPTTLNCKAEGIPMPHIEWYKDGEKVRPTANRMLLPSGGLFFLFVETRKKDPDTGVYWCVARNELGKAKSRNATVSIATPHKQPRITESPKHIVVKKNEAATLSCKVEGKPTPAIEWYKDGEKLRVTDNRVILPSGSLFFLHVRVDQEDADTGTYWCVARNEVGFAKSQHAVLEVAGEVLAGLMPATDKELDEGIVGSDTGSGAGAVGGTASSGGIELSDAFKKPWFIIIEALTVMFVTSSAVLIFLMRQMSSKKPVTTHVMYTSYKGEAGGGGGGYGSAGQYDRELVRDDRLWLNQNSEWAIGTADNGNTSSKVLNTSHHHGYANKMADYTAIDSVHEQDTIYEEVSSSGSLSTFGKNKNGKNQEPSPYAMTTII